MTVQIMLIADTETGKAQALFDAKLQWQMLDVRDVPAAVDAVPYKLHEITISGAEYTFLQRNPQPHITLTFLDRVCEQLRKLGAWT